MPTQYIHEEDNRQSGSAQSTLEIPESSKVDVWKDLAYSGDEDSDDEDVQMLQDPVLNVLSPQKLEA